MIDFDKVIEIAQREKPKMIICGASAYSRDWDYKKLREAADSVGALLLADISHPAGLIARGLLQDPMEDCHIVTTTTHKTLRGPRGGMILVGKNFDNPWGLKTPKGELRKITSILDSGVFPGTQGGPLEHVIAAKAVSFIEALSDDYMNYILQVSKNAKVMADAFLERGYKIISGGTDNHLMLIDLRNKNITGKKAQETLDKAHITLNKNAVPFDDKSPFVTSGIRVGVPAITSRGMKEEHMQTVVDFIDRVLMNIDDTNTVAKVEGEVHEFMKQFPLYPELG